MARHYRLAILSDIHYAGPTESSRGEDYEFKAITNPILRVFARLYRNFIWQRYPVRQGRLLDRFMGEVGEPDYVIGNGDYCLDAHFVGVSDDATAESAAECLGKLRARFGDRLRVTLGDHDLGKLHMFGATSGLPLASWHRATGALAVEPFWRLDLGNWVLLGVTSTLVALPAYEQDLRTGEKEEWEQLRTIHLEKIRTAFASLRPDQRVILFCHDPTALPFLWHDEVIREHVNQVEQTLIGHLHSNLVLWKARLLSGMPVIGFLGPSVQKMSRALNEARHWQPFHVRLCPALAGIQLLNDGGWYDVELDAEAKQPARFVFRPMPR